MNNTDTFTLPIRIAVHWYLKMLYAVSAIFFLSLTIAIWLNLRSLPMLLLFGFFAFLSIYAFLSSFTTIQIDENSVMVTAPYGVYKIDWADVTVIETNTIDDRRFESKDDIFAFIGENKCLATNLRFADKEKAEFYRFITKQIDRLQVEVKPLSSKWLSHKNTRIRRFGF